MSEVEKPMLAVLLHRFFLPETQREPEAAAEGEAQLQSPLKVLDQALAKRGHLAGDDFSIADLNVASVLSWAKLAHMNLSAHPHVSRWLDACLARPAAAKAMALPG